MATTIGCDIAVISIGAGVVTLVVAVAEAATPASAAPTTRIAYWSDWA